MHQLHGSGTIEAGSTDVSGVVLMHWAFIASSESIVIMSALVEVGARTKLMGCI